jgi:hypothetical protein
MDRGFLYRFFPYVYLPIYEKEIREFDVKVIGKEYREAFEKLKKQYNCTTQDPNRICAC